MLPQFPTLQRDLGNRVKDYVIEKKATFLGELGKLPSHHILEGHQSVIIREDGKLESTKMMLGESAVAIPFDEFPSMTLESLLRKFDDAAFKLAKTQAEHTYATMAEGAASIGNTVDAHNQPFTAEMYLVALGKIHIEFLPSGEPIIPTLHIHPSKESITRMEIDRLRNDPVLNKTFVQLLERKFGEWRAREASRELAG